jgi:hypothetical protein
VRQTASPRRSARPRVSLAPVILAVLVLLFAAVGEAFGQETLESGAVRVVFDRSHRAFALGVLGEISGAEDRVRTALGLELKAPRTIRLVADQDELDVRVREITGHDAPDWAGAIAIAANHLVLLRVDLPRRDDVAVRSVVAHELAHLALAEAVAALPEPVRIPRWLEEGFAQIAAGRGRPDEVVDLRPAAFFGRLLDVTALDAAFAGGEGAAATAYAQAESFLRRLISQYGPGVPSKLIRSLLSGTSLEVAVQSLGGFPFESEWDAWVRELRADKKWIAAFVGQSLLGALFLVVVALAFLRRKRKDAGFQEKWKAEEESAAGTADEQGRSPVD